MTCRTPLRPPLPPRLTGINGFDERWQRQAFGRPHRGADARRHRAEFPLTLAVNRVKLLKRAAVLTGVPARQSGSSDFRQHFHYILNTPNVVSGIGALRAAENAKPKTRRVSWGVMMPSSHKRAVAKYGLPSRS